MPTPSRTGTPSQIDASGAGSGSTSVNVPADCNLIVAFWSHWDNNGNTTLSTLSLGGNDFLPALSELAEGAATDELGVGVAILVNPPTGAQNVSWAWSAGGARQEGGLIVLVYYKDGNTSDPYRAVATDAQTFSNPPSATVANTAATDLVVGFTSTYAGAGNPVITGVTAFIDNATLNSHIHDVGDATGLTGNVTVSNSNPDYSVAAAISLKESVSGGGPQFLRPSSDISTGAWQPNPSSPATLYDKIDEETADDADYIFTTTINTTCEVALSAPSGTPGAGSRIVRWRSPAGYSPNGGITVTLMQGTTQIAQWTTPAVAANTTYTHTLSQAEADSITDYSDLRLRFTSS